MSCDALLVRVQMSRLVDRNLSGRKRVAVQAKT